jgi:formiminoglutamate deiminase
MTTIWYAPHAWLGGDQLESDVLIGVSDGTIASISSGDAKSADRTMDGVVLPGLVSAHSHAFHRALRGQTHADGGDFWAWRQPMYELANTLTPDSYRDLATHVFNEMVSAGITTVGEFHYIHHLPNGERYEDPNAVGLALADAARIAGIRMTLIDTAYLTSDVDGTPVGEEQTRFSDGSIDEWSARVRSLASALGDDPMIRLGVAAHSVRGVGVHDLGTIARTATELDAPLHIHASEQVAENQACLAHHGVTPIGLLASNGVLGPRTTVVHATHLTAGDINLIAESGSTVCFCPTTEADLGDGIGPALELVEAGVTICLGSDSNAVIDILHEATRLEHHDRLRLMRRGIHSSQALASMATANGMRSLGWPLGGLAVGSPADFIAVDTSGSELARTGGSLAAVMSSATRASVTDVVVGGVVRKESR